MCSKINRNSFFLLLIFIKAQTDFQMAAQPISRLTVLLSCAIGLFVILYVLWSEESPPKARLRRPEALHAAAVAENDASGSVIPLFLKSRWIASNAWSSPSGHHLPNLKRMISSALGVSDFGATELQNELKQILSVGERGESRVFTATATLRYTVDVSLFLRPEHRQRIRAWLSRSLNSNKHVPLSPTDSVVRSGVDVDTASILVVKDIPWNLAQSLPMCEMLPLLSSKSLSCSSELRSLVQKLHDVSAKHEKVMKQDDNDLPPRSQRFVNPAIAEQLMRKYADVDKFYERYILAGAASRQGFHAVFNDGAHFATSAIGLGQQLCDGSRTGRDLDYIEAKVESAASRVTWNEYLQTRYGVELQRLIQQDVTESTTSLRAEEILMKKVKIWNPIRAALEQEDAGMVDVAQDVILAEEGKVSAKDADALEVLFRPTLMCVMMTTFGEGLRLAILQHLLWGDMCDDFLIVVASGDANGQERLHRAFSDLQRIARIKPDRLVHVRMSGDEVKRNLWMQFQLALGALDERNNLDHIYQYYYFATDDTFLIPENLYDMLMQPEIFTLNAASTPLLLGNVMVEPSEQIAYASSGPGVVLNTVALRLALTLSPTDACRSKLISNAWEVLLAECLATAGVVARDTTDELGEDRFHILSLHWLLLAPSLGAAEELSRPQSSASPAESWWYDAQRPRASREVILGNPFRALSSSSIAFNKVNTAEKALWMHMQLRHS